MKPAIALLTCALFATQSFADDFSNWRHSGSLTILTTPDGANLPASAVIEQFPVLVRLSRDWFDFSQAKPRGEDVRFSTGAGEPLAFEIEEWDAANGTASIWVRVPRISGNARQEIRMHWGKADAASASNARAVFNESNGYLSVWHMGDEARDVTGMLESKDTGTTATAGVAGKARHFTEGHGIFCGDKITGYPTGSAPHTSEAWMRAETANGHILGWGNEKAQGKVVMHLASPPHVKMDCYFSDANVEGTGRVPMREWTHVVHTYEKGNARVYVNGVLDGTSEGRGAPLAIQDPARLWIGGWYGRYDFIGDLDEVRFSKVARPADWVRLEFENQKPLQTLVGPFVTAGDIFAVAPAQGTVAEGKSATFTAQAGGTQKVSWSLVRDGRETLVAVDRFKFTFDAGRVTSDTAVTLRFKAVTAGGVKTRDIPIIVKEAIPEPVFTLHAPAAWDGRSTIEVMPQIANAAAMTAAGAGVLKTNWKVEGIATVKEITGGKLVLKRAQNNGTLKVTATVDNGGHPETQMVRIAVTEPTGDPWIARMPSRGEKPEEGQFYARDDRNEGTLHYNGTLTDSADSVFLRVYADDRLLRTESAKPAADKSYALSAKLKPGLIRYRVEFGTRTGGRETVLQNIGNLVCGDAYIIEGQSNALATDTREDAPPETNEWIRSYGRPPGNPNEATGNLWCNPVWKARNGEKAELGWWGMELAKRLLASQKVPIFIINAAVGGTRIDQHQRNESDPTDLTTIYGRMLWRVQHARLTDGIRGILWHQGENNQGSAGPTGDYDWKAYEDYFIEMSAAWKRDFPNVRHYYVFQIWPNSCSMAGNTGAGDMIREIQRSLPRLYSNMGVMSTLGIRPPGGCHFPLTGWSEFARLIQPLIERDNYGGKFANSITPPNLRRAYYADHAKDSIALEFDQPVLWTDALNDQFYLDGEKNRIATATLKGNVLTLKLKAPGTATRITYLKETAWSQDKLLIGTNGIAALTFCDVPVLTVEKANSGH